MENCIYCGKMTSTSIRVEELGKYAPVCKECREKKKKERIENDLKGVQRADDFKHWKKEDMSEAFWIHLGKYQKHPNKKSLNIIYRAWLWAVHDDHGLANSFHNALKWCGLDLNIEIDRDDLPEDFKEEE